MKMDKILINNWLWRIAQIVFKQGTIALIFFIGAKNLSIEEFGLYNYLLAIIMATVMFSDFGISTSTAKYVSEYKTNNKEKIKHVLMSAGILVISAALICSLILLFIIKDKFMENYIAIIGLIPLIILIPLTALYDGIYRGLEEFRKLSIISIVISIISIPLIIVLISKYTLIGAIISQSLFYLLLFIGLTLGHKENELKIKKEIIQEIGKYSLAYGVAVFGNFLFIKAGIILLGSYGYLREIATYQVINQFFSILLLPFILFGQVIAPNFVKLKINNNLKKILLETKKYTKYSFIIGIIITLLLYIALPKLIFLFLPKYYDPLFLKIFPAMCLIFMFNTWAATIDAGIIVPTGYAKMMSKIYLLLGIIGFIACAISIKILGFMGVIYTFVFSSLLMVLILRFSFIREISKLVNK